jgi:acyl CoA:acetate/3-ketoacid CoA transferase beta subunit
MVVSLGMGIPSLVPEYTDKTIVFTTTTGVLGAGHFPEKN